jgi:hypothetical protein
MTTSDIVEDTELELRALSARLTVPLDGIVFREDPHHPDPMPSCQGVRRGSTRGCTLWMRRRRW